MAKQFNYRTIPVQDSCANCKYSYRERAEYLKARNLLRCPHQPKGSWTQRPHAVVGESKICDLHIQGVSK